jgi:hypothetical protein
MLDLSRWRGDKAIGLGWNRERLKITVSWVAAGVGALIGLFSLVVAGMTSLENPRSLGLSSLAVALEALFFMLFRELAAWSILPLCFGGFWLGTYRSGWRPLRAERQWPLRCRVGIALLVIVCVALVTLSSTFIVFSRRSTIEIVGDGSGPGRYTLHFLDLPEGQCATEITVTKEELVQCELYELHSRLFWCDAQ